ncbi:hypothetical protein [Pseudomonas sp. TMW 2.1634]|uniref:hypothetical protein n=1 Tax=Pseudomonas sp. TMW 2.1634 TaxID=1886807 RepID=UPI000E75C32C|nr:hypothetical protein [Pseudomonas sp. TMW 2.1634]AOA04627.1 hypothetical protein BFC21_02040 [Pseudomonas sp. TMW 2.1634]
MARQEIILGTPPTGLGGDPPRTASMKINAMTQELYDKNAALGTAASADMTTSRDDPTPGRVNKTGDYGIGLPLSGRIITSRAFPIGKACGVSFDYLTGQDRPPSSTDGALMTLTYNDEFYFQTYFDWRLGDLHTISKATPTTAQVWRKFYNNDNALGLVSNGALLEFGSNANGDYARFASGVQICWRTSIAPELVNSSNIGATWNFPMPFLAGALPNIMVNFASGELAVRKLFNGPGAAVRSPFTCLASVWSQGAFGHADLDGVSFSLVAIGRWK